MQQVTGHLRQLRGPTHSVRSGGVRIWLALVGLALAAPAAAPAEADDSTQTILVLGDSLAAGSGVGKESAFPRFLQDRIDEAQLPYRVINAGVSGDTTAGGLRRINWLLREKVDVLLIELGGNDGLRGIQPATTKANLTEMVRRARTKYPEVTVVIAGMQMPPNMGEKYTEEFRAVFPAVAKETGAVLIPFLLEGIGADPAFNQEDLIHPTREGHQIVAETVWQVLGPVLKGQRSKPKP